MIEYPRLSKAPIILAVLEIRFAVSDSMTLKKMSGLKAIYKDQYPVQVNRNSAQFQFRPGVSAIPVNFEQDAYVFTSATKKHELLITRNSFTFFQHGSYDTWDSFKGTGISDWLKCSSFIQPLKIERLSLRYVNSIELSYPRNTEQPQENFFKTAIIGPHRNRSISQYFLRYTNPPGPDRVTVHFAQELKLGVSGVFPFIVDIDVLFDNDSQDFLNVDLMVRKFDELRDIKNEYFFRNLTEETLSQIK